jgi:hypothetical protein
MIVVQFCVRKQVLGRSNFEPAKTDAKRVARGQAVMRVLIAVFLFLDFVLTCFVAAQLFHL